MTYHSRTGAELRQAGIQEGELAVYTGVLNPRQAKSLLPGWNSRRAYAYLWRDGQPLELDAQYQCDGAGLNVLEVQAGAEQYTFLQDRPSGIRQTGGPAAPIVAANIGATPLRVDTFLGKFTVHAGTMLRLDENAPQREKKTVLLTVTPQPGQPLSSAELWDGAAWRRLNIREEPAQALAERGWDVLDGGAIVQHMTVNIRGELLMMDAPEPDPDYKILVSVWGGGQVKLWFDRSDYQDGKIVRRSRRIWRTLRTSFYIEAYDLQKLRESQTQAEAEQCAVELPGRPAEKSEFTPEEWNSLPYRDQVRYLSKGGIEEPADELPSGDELRDLLEDIEEPADEIADTMFRGFCALGGEGAVPEPPEDFPA